MEVWATFMMQFHQQFLITYSGYRLVNVLWWKFNTSSKGEMKKIQTQSFWWKKSFWWKNLIELMWTNNHLLGTSNISHLTLSSYDFIISHTCFRVSVRYKLSGCVSESHCSCLISHLAVIILLSIPWTFF